MIKDIDTQLENVACTAQGVAHTLGLLGAEAYHYSEHIGSSAFLMQEVCQKISDDLYKIFNELRGGVNGKNRVTNVAHVPSQEKVSLRTSCFTGRAKS